MFSANPDCLDGHYYYNSIRKSYTIELANKNDDALSSRNYLTPSDKLESEGISNAETVLTMASVQSECNSSPVEV